VKLADVNVIRILFLVPVELVNIGIMKHACANVIMLTLSIVHSILSMSSKLILANVVASIQSNTPAIALIETLCGHGTQINAHVTVLTLRLKKLVQEVTN
jgi:hypothetical protein